MDLRDGQERFANKNRVYGTDVASIQPVLDTLVRERIRVRLCYCTHCLVGITFRMLNGVSTELSFN